MKIVRAVEARSSSALKRSSTFDDAICVRGARMADPLAKQSAESACRSQLANQANRFNETS